MYYILRAKAVSLCLGIRRATISYFTVGDKVISLNEFEHPLKPFKEIKLLGNYAEILGNSNELKIGEDTFFYKINNVVTPTGEAEEQITLGLMLLPLDIAMKDYYEDAINEGYLFDQWSGEFEYILGMMYELTLNDMTNANIYYEKAKAKGFKFKLVK